jgi:hypothetical protein
VLYVVLLQCLFLSVFVFYSIPMFPAVFLIYFISVSVVLLMNLALMVKFSLLCNRVGKASICYSVILVFFNVFCGLNILLIMPVIFK